MELKCNAHPSQIFFTLFFSWSPWKKIMNTDLWTWSPCWKRVCSMWWLCIYIYIHTLLNFSVFIISVLCWPWRGPPEGPQSLPFLKRHYRDTRATASFQRLESFLGRSRRPQTCKKLNARNSGQRSLHVKNIKLKSQGFFFQHSPQHENNVY